jgi:hypothetical protein
VTVAGSPVQLLTAMPDAEPLKRRVSPRVVKRAAWDDACATALAGTIGLQNKRYTRGLQ